MPSPSPQRQEPRPSAPHPLIAGTRRLLTGPLSAAAIDRIAREKLRPALRVAMVLVPVVLLVVIAYMAADLWSQMPPELAPRHRAEAVCFALAQPDLDTHESFKPPMRIEPSAALVQGRFALGTPAAMALRQVMQLDESMVLEESQRMVDDYVVSVLWLDLPHDRSGNAAGGDHWLVLAWMEGADLAVCNFRFAGDETGSRQLSFDEQQWGVRLVNRVLVPENFRAGSLPHVGLRATHGHATLPAFGPVARR